MKSELLSGYPGHFMLEMKRCEALQTVVEMIGFEPTTSSSRMKVVVFGLYLYVNDISDID